MDIFDRYNMSLDTKLRDYRKKSSEYKTAVVKISLTDIDFLRKMILKPLEERAAQEKEGKKPATKCLESLRERLRDENEWNSWLIESIINRAIQNEVWNSFEKRKSNLFFRGFYKTKWAIFRFYQKLRRISPKVRAEDKKFEEFLFGKKDES